MKNIIKNYFISNDIKNNNIVYGFFSRNGGYSKSNFFSLNCSSNSGDNKNVVKKNIQNAKNTLGLENNKIKLLKQTHSNQVEIIDRKNINYLTEADGSITKDKKIALAILTADCAPVFVFDKHSTLICSLHVGWKGCLYNIIKNALNKILQMQILSNNLIAIVGPCLDKENFEVEDSFKYRFISKNSEYENFFSKKTNQKKSRFDMRGLINFQLQNCFLNQISNISLDTYKNEELFYSHRKSIHQGISPTGRMINIIGFR